MSTEATDRVSDLDLVEEPEEERFEPDPDALAGHGDIRDRLRERRDALRQSKTIDLLIPGYDDDLACRYRAIPGKEAELIANKVGRNGEGQKVARDLLIRCCETILVRPTEAGLLEPLEEDGAAVRYDERLARYLGFEARKASEVVQGVFSPEHVRDLAHVDQATALLNWMQGRERDIDRSLLGE